MTTKRPRHSGRDCRRRRAVSSVLLLFVAGCGRSVETASISGRVTFDDRPVANGTIAFLPCDGQGPAAGAIINGGAYAVGKLAPGPKLVRVEAFAEQVAFPRSRGDLEQQARDRPPPGGAGPPMNPSLIPPDAPGNDAEVTIVRGPQVQNFEITRPVDRSPRP